MGGALTLFACVTLAAMAGWWIFSAPPAEAAQTPRQISAQALRERKKAVYENLKDLHFEHLAGKLSDSDFQRTRAMLENEAAQVNTALDALNA